MKKTDSKAAKMLINRKAGVVSQNTRITERDGTYALELFGNEIAWHHADGTVEVRTTVPSYTTHMRLNAVAFELSARFQCYTERFEHYVIHNKERFEDCASQVFTLRGPVRG